VGGEGRWRTPSLAPTRPPGTRIIPAPNSPNPLLPPSPKNPAIVPETYASRAQLEQLAARLGVDVHAALDAGSKAARKRKKGK
jgi:hypothetical protein